MKIKIPFLLLSFIIYVTAKSQSNTLEITPTFQQKNQEFISEVIDFSPSFDDLSFVGISCYHFDADYKNIQYRVLHREQWSEWKPFSPQHELDLKIRTAYEGQFITSACSALQFKTADNLETSLTIRLFMGQKSTSSADLQKRSILCTLPAVCDRSCWCSSCPIDNTPEFTTPTHIIIHHSAGSNQPNLNFAEVVNYIWDLHVKTNGWDDIGYNWLIDPNGIVYEGRPDGYQGAHFSCINENTVGICLLGDFTSISPSNDAMNTLVDLVAYEATEHSIDVLDASYHETGEFVLSNVAGHRQSSGSANSCSTTACPGNTFYPMLDSIRIKVAELECYDNTISNTHTVDRASWSVYPNPFQNTLQVMHEGKSSSNIKIKDSTGQLCGTFPTNQPSDLSHLPNGVYFLLHDNQIIEKVIKQK